MWCLTFLKIVMCFFQASQSNESHSDSVLPIPDGKNQLVDSKTGNNSFGQHGMPSDVFNDNFSVKSESNSMYDMDTSPSHGAEDMISVDSIGK